MTEKKERIYYIDNLRIFLCILTIAFHNIRSYADYWWYPVPTPRTSPLLTPYVSIFLAFGMNLFFVITGYFTVMTLDRCDTKTFHRRRIKRLLVPLLIFMAIMPFVMYSQFLSVGYVENIGFFDYIINYYFGFGIKPEGWINPIWPDFNYGHLWFIGHLLFFGFVYSYYHDKQLKSGLLVEKKDTAFPSLPKILIFILLLSILTFIIRIWFRMSSWTMLLLIIQISPAHLPQYIIFYMIGLKAYRSNWKEQITEKIGKFSLLIMTICIVIIYYANTIIPVFDPIYQVGFSIQQFFYAVWEIVLSVSTIISFIYLFKKYFRKQNDFLKKMTKQTYMVYILHVPVLLGIQTLFLSLLWDPILLSFIVFIIAVPLLFSASIILHKIPYIKKYL